jgi:phage terminase large subunit GpA-like protein
MSNLSQGHAAMQALLDAFARGCQPEPDMPIDQWSDTFMVIPKDSGANEYGKYQTDRTPHARAIMQALSAGNKCKRVVAMVASQMFKTQIALNFLCSTIHQQPANFLWLMPTGKLAKRISKRIDKTVAAVPAIAAKVANPRSRDAANNQDTKEYEGGTLFIATAGSAANLAEVPARYLVYDEIDRSETNVDQEGSPSAMAEARQTSFEQNRKAYYPSSPTIDGESNVQMLYNQGTQREALAECIHCGHLQPLVFEALIFNDQTHQAEYPCAECGCAHIESDKSRMFAQGAWSEGVPGDGETESFTASQMFLPYGWTSWTTLYKLHQAAAIKRQDGSDELMVAFYNTRLARVWKKDAETTSAQSLRDRAEDYKHGTVEAAACVLTATIDTQADRLELKVVGWGEGLEAWVVDYQVIQGSPDEDATWNKADAILRSRYRHAHGLMLPISAAFIDSGGTATQEVYSFTRPRRRLHVYPIKGASRPGRPILSSKPSIIDFNWRGVTEKGGVKLWLIGTDTAKDYLAARWKKSSGPGAVHFSKDLLTKTSADDPTPDYFDGLTAEYRTGGYKRGHRVTWWEKKKGHANEPLDLMVYNLAAAHYLGLHKRTANQWQTLRDSLNPNTGDLFQANAPEASEKEEKTDQTPQPASIDSYKTDSNPARNAKRAHYTPGRIGLAQLRKMNA